MLRKTRNKNLFVPVAYKAHMAKTKSVPVAKKTKKKASTKKTTKKKAKKKAKKTCFTLRKGTDFMGRPEEHVVFPDPAHAYCLFNHCGSSLRTTKDGGYQIPSAAVYPVLRRLESMQTLRGEAEEGRLALISFINERLKTRLQTFNELKEQGVIMFLDLWILFTEGQKVTIPDAGGVLVAGEVVSADIRTGFVGTFFTATIKSLKHDGDCFEWVHYSHRIRAFEGVQKISQLGITILETDDDLRPFQERGARIVEFCEKPSYLHYEGNVLQRSRWLGNKEFRSTGRCMIDVKSFSQMNENYDGMDDCGEDSVEEVPYDALYAVSPWVMGFSFTSKVWGEFNAENLSPIEFNRDAYDMLVLPDRTIRNQPVKPKKMIRSLVERGTQGFTDIISGKGGGVVFLLHGPPGVGKTLTAEAVADLLERPLYAVDISELGTNMEKLEKNLRKILEVATTWNAVLLLDEADVFLEKRTVQDIERNAMVGVFLRMLEYYQGVLFMTTNRVNEFDPAFNSRISIALRYPPLDRETRIEIWKNLLTKAGLDYQTLNVPELANYDINGRQIKNAIRIGLALAAEEGRSVTKGDITQTIVLGEAFNEDLAAQRDDLHIEVKGHKTVDPALRPS